MQGLTSKQAEERVRQYGLNVVREKKPGVFIKFLKWLITPISLMLAAAAGLSLAAKNIFDFWFIAALALLNFFVSFWQESKADKAVEKLQEKLSVQARVLRDGQWMWLRAQNLVPGDILRLEVGDVVPADAMLLSADNVTVNEASLTGESMPKEKAAGAQIFSGSFIATGKAEAQVSATGRRTSFGKALLLAGSPRRRSLLEQDIIRISKFLSALSVLAVLILTSVLLLEHAPLLEILLLDLGLVIAGIPVSLPAVMSLIIGFGVLGLAKKNAVVRQLSALEDLANVNLLLSDKTGTLTRNLISVEKVVVYDKTHSVEELVKLAAATASQEKNPIDRAVIGRLSELGLSAGYPAVKVVPGDSLRKRSTAVVEMGANRRFCVSLGAVQVVAGLCNLEPKAAARLAKDTAQFADQGFRSLALAMAPGESEINMKLLGILLLSDTLFADARTTVDFLKENGIEVKMLTGDSASISRRIAADLGLDGTSAQVMDKASLDKINLEQAELSWWQDKAGFAEILPEDKLRLVKSAQKYFRVAVTGDGVNDLPAVKTADVGIAVSNAVDSLKSAADLVLLKPGIAVIKDAVLEARKIFSRLYSYSVYRISESLRLIITIAVLGLIYKAYPLSAVQLILLAFLNDLPIISLAFNRVSLAGKPAAIKVKQRFVLSSLLGLTGVANSLLMFYLAGNIFHLSLPVIETLFFLKLAIGGHMLIYVAHTEKRWDTFLPSRPVIFATTITQLLATIFAIGGIFMVRVPVIYVVIVWVWAFFWMQVSEAVKHLARFLSKEK